jgi:hypothetical protein
LSSSDLYSEIRVILSAYQSNAVISEPRESHANSNAMQGSAGLM